MDADERARLVKLECKLEETLLKLEDLADDLNYEINHRTEFTVNSFGQLIGSINHAIALAAAAGVMAWLEAPWWFETGAFLVVFVGILVWSAQSIEKSIARDKKNLGEFKSPRFPPPFD